MTTQEIETDFVIVGGGLAGVCAALAAARNGIRVVLVQDRSVLGGNASSEVKMHIVGADCHGTRPGARESGLIEELKLEDAVRNPHRSYSQWDLLLYEKIVLESRITLLLDTDCTGCVVEGDGKQRRIVAVKAVRNSTEDDFVLRAKFFADCSGDSRLGLEAGADYVIGREAKETYDEPLGLATADVMTLGASILFTARCYAEPQPFLAPAWARRFQKHEFRHRPIKGYEYGYWWSEWGGQLDMIKDAPAIRHELLRIALGIWDYIKNSGDHPDAANWALEWVGPIPGKRESRRLLGPHVLTQNDVVNGRIFPDQVAFGGWWLDLHPPTGLDAIDEPPCEQVHFPHLYSISLRSLYSRNVANLFMAGRNISASHVAFASTRVMGTCATMGQAVGTAAALAVQEKLDRSSSLIESTMINQLQQRLLKDDAFLPGLANNDPSDLARQARVAASSETKDGAAPNVIDGFARELPSHLGAWADGGTHFWQSATLPAWIELAWPEPVRISEIHLTFDSGFQRELILSASDSISQKTIRGPQPELVDRYNVAADGKIIVSVDGNSLRKRIHRLPAPLTVARLRIGIISAHDLAAARLFEVRVY
ncbi:MAG: dependent oxidoreductase family protein [Lacunisphaera sp.]|nr:dependent oxidoreductase family protein [Lacunisphaera sp.]